MNGRYELTDQADQDLLDAAYYIGRDSVEAADRWIERMHHTFERLAQFPQMGRERTELAPHLRSFPSGSYIIFYRATDAGIEIIRVLHGARDIDAIFNP